MDSITQFVLGAAVSTACLGNKIGPRKAALVGGLLGTLPDLDVFIPFDDPIDSFVYHRGWTHSVFVHALAAPVIGEVLMRLFKGLREHRWLTWSAVFLVLSTHAIIDAMTVYGTRIFWPVYPDPVGVGSVFIIDPVYSVPLIIVVIYALCKKTWTTRLRNWVAGALMFTTAYLGVSAVLQQYVQAQAREVFQNEGTEPETVYAIAAPFNILLWKVIGLRQDQYQNLYYSLLDSDGPPEIYKHPRHPELSACLQNTPAYKKLAWFSRGFFRTELVDQKVIMSDLRMGLTPGYAFRFVVGQLEQQEVRPVAPQRDAALGRIDEDDWAWFVERIQGHPSVRNAEARSETSEGLVKASVELTCGSGATGAVSG
ncbi:metal-dependent hydrolase [Roseibium sp. MMSF_3544]|uniref:metal-dependent hydrolase n=1 Tax=unclassified Roseibium TaxID=2629323 RepID=UPI00273EDE1A|nr:metal-dependent hydrolase [Roseibium sp. MMSF_3544]